VANVQQITRDYVLRATTQGVAETTAAAQRLGAATDVLATKTEAVTKSQTSAAAALEKHQRSLDLNYRASKQYESVQRDLDRAQQQGLITTARHAELMALASQRFNQVGRSGQAFGVITQSLNAQVQASAGSLGTMGQALSATGPDRHRGGGHDRHSGAGVQGDVGCLA
jgi:3-hydroxyisobutyrate dehydrogenase-like beta-hydroxyacid dehydrogenase